MVQQQALSLLSACVCLCVLTFISVSWLSAAIGPAVSVALLQKPAADV